MKDMETNPKYLRLRQENDLNVHLPLWRKICFAVGGVPYQSTSTVIGFFLTIFLLEVALLDPKYVSIILFAGKAWDAITDPTIGLLVQKTNTRWGKMRPWILFSAPLACATYFFLFYVPWAIKKNSNGEQIVDADQGIKFAYYFAMFCLFEGFLSCLHVPYTALTMYITNEQKERDSITAIRMALEAIGVLVAVIVEGAFVSRGRCTGRETFVNTTNVNIEHQVQGYMHGSIVVITLYVICCLTVFFGSKELPGVVQDASESRLGVLQGLKLVFKFKPYRWASLTFLFMFMAIAIVQGNLALYCTHSLKMGEDFAYFVFVLLVVSIVAMPCWQFVSKKFGKKTAYAAGMIIMIPVCFAQLYLPEQVYWLYYIIMALSGLGISVAFLLPWSVLPDILDLYMLENNVRHDALFYSFYVFFNKLASGLALALSQLVLSFGGYESGKCVQPDSVDKTLRYLLTPGPLILLLIALFCLYRYPINEVSRKRIKHQIMELALQRDSQPGSERELRQSEVFSIL